MSKEDNYEVTAREDVTADIPVANVPEGAENALLPKKESEDDDLIVKFRKRPNSSKNFRLTRLKRSKMS